MSSADMTAPVTRGELREELALHRQDTQQQLSALETRLEARFDQKLDLWGGALLERIKETEKQIKETEKQIKESEKRLSVELAGHAKVIQESMRSQFVALDDRYADLPGRVRRLEESVF